MRSSPLSTSPHAALAAFAGRATIDLRRLRVSKVVAFLVVLVLPGSFLAIPMLLWLRSNRGPLSSIKTALAFLRLDGRTDRKGVGRNRASLASVPLQRGSDAGPAALLRNSFQLGRVRFELSGDAKPASSPIVGC
jgi:hypothetical protein